MHVYAHCGGLNNIDIKALFQIIELESLVVGPGHLYFNIWRRIAGLF